MNQSILQEININTNKIIEIVKIYKNNKKEVFNFSIQKPKIEV